MASDLARDQSAVDELWYKNAVLYAVDVELFQDANGDGIGDFQGLIQRIPYLKELGITCIWLLPFYPTPNRDNGYDIRDYFEVDPSHGTLAQFIEFVHRAGEAGIRVLIDLVVNHTSNEHPWFQAARRDPDSRYRDYYVWTDNPPPTPPGEGTIFPGQENSVWTWDDTAGAYYYHRFYEWEPELRIANPAVREEIYRIIDFWLSFGVAGFRVDAASHMIAAKGIDATRPDDPHGVLRDLRAFVDGRKPGGLLIGESDVEVERIADFFGDGDELNMLFNFLLDNYLILSLAQQSAKPIARLLGLLPTIPYRGQWANFLRNLDELDLERLSDEEREQVFRAFAPEPEMRIFGRGVRRRIAPMLDGDRRRLEMAYSLLFSMPGSPVLVYGDEIGMGDDLQLPGRSAVRTPMQWSDAENAGFSDARAELLPNPVIEQGPFAYERVNVEAQRLQTGSFLEWVKQLTRARRMCPEWGWGPVNLIETAEPAVLAHRCEWRGGVVLAVHNLSDQPCSVELDLAHEVRLDLEQPLGNATWSKDDGSLHVELQEYGYLWLRAER